MEARKLMLGDYVDYYGRIARITKLEDEGSLGGNVSLEYNQDGKIKIEEQIGANELNHLPITIEFLEHNGFKKTKKLSEDGLYWELVTPDWSIEYSIYIGDCLESPDYLLSLYNRRRSFDSSDIPCKSIHEFQHIIRMFDIDLDIFVKV